MKRVDDYKVEIVTGQLCAASDADREMVEGLFGADAALCFELYFHWYNIIHELGHAIYDFHCPQRHHNIEEEQWVNYFAVAYWRHYGEPQKLEWLGMFVKETLERYAVPQEYEGDILKYGKDAWERGTLYSFNNYGFFQFGCVAQALSANVTLKQVLWDMGIVNVQEQEKELLSYPVDAAMPGRVLADARNRLERWGVALPEEMSVVLVDDPNCHMCRVEER